MLVGTESKTLGAFLTFIINSPIYGRFLDQLFARSLLIGWLVSVGQERIVKSREDCQVPRELNLTLVNLRFKFYSHFMFWCLYYHYHHNYYYYIASIISRILLCLSTIFIKVIHAVRIACLSSCHE